MSYHSTLLTNTVYSNQCHGVFTLSDSILYAQCHGYRWYSGGEGCDENIYYTITCSCVYPATAFGKFRRDCLLKSDMSFGDFATSCRGRLSIGNLQGHTPWVFDWVPSRTTSSPTAKFKIITSVTVVRYFRAAPLNVHVCFRRQTCLTHHSVTRLLLRRTIFHIEC